MLPRTKPKVSENQLVEDFMRRLSYTAVALCHPCDAADMPRRVPGDPEMPGRRRLFTLYQGDTSRADVIERLIVMCDRWPVVR